MDTWWKDVRYSLRLLRHNWIFTLVATATLALGLGASSTVFSIVHAVVLDPLPFREPDELVVLWDTDEGQGTHEEPTSIPDYLDWRARCRSFAGMAAYRFWGLALTEVPEPVDISTALVTPSLFDVLGVRPQHGRAFLEEESEPGKDGVVILTHGFWRQRYAGDPEILGRKLHLEGRSYTIVGVLPPDSKFPSAETELFIPLTTGGSLDRTVRDLRVIARLAPGITPEAAREELAAVASAVAKEHPDTNRSRGATLVPLLDQMVGKVRPLLIVLCTAVASLLLIACANIANLLLARTVARQQEVALRVAIGASGWRIVRQLLIESVLLALAGGAGGLLLSYWGIKLLATSMPYTVPRLEEAGIDPVVISFSLVLALLCGVLFGLAPALRARHPDVTRSLKEGNPTGSVAGRRSRAGNLLIAAEVALTVPLLMSAGLLIRTFFELNSVKLGFEPQNLQITRLYLSWSKYSEPRRQEQFFLQLLERIQSLPGVVSTASVTALPFTIGGDDFEVTYRIEERPDLNGGQPLRARFRAATTNYFRTMGIPIVKGRSFTDQDRSEAPPVVLINETLAKRFWPNGSPIGKKLYADLHSREIVGVVGDVLHYGLDSETSPEIYFPFLQKPFIGMTVITRTSADPNALAKPIQEQIWSLEPNQTVFGVSSMESLIGESVTDRRFAMRVIGFFAGASLLLAMLGIHGVTSYLVGQRRKEFGIRMALGAESHHILREVLGRGMLFVSLGFIAGGFGSLAMTQLLRQLLFQVPITDPYSALAAIIVLASAAALGLYLPTRGAMRVDPTTAIRAE